MSKINLQDFTKCYICMEQIRKPSMCPSCNKFACYECVKKWLMNTRSECPHCRKFLRISDIVECRFVANLASVRL